MQKALVFSLPMLLVFGTLAVGAQPRYPFPRATPSPTPAPTPRPTPEARPAPCPTVAIQAPAGRAIRDGQPVTFAANINGGDPKSPLMINWSLSGGVINNGQGTRKIDVDTTGSGSSPDRQITADIWVAGGAPECPQVQASASVKIIPPAMKFGEFGDLPADALATNLKALAQFLSTSPDNLYLIGYAGRNNERGFAANSIRKMKDALVAEGIAARRVIALDGGFREEPLFDFWIVPIGADPPRPSPTVNRNEIVYPRTAPVRKP